MPEAAIESEPSPPPIPTRKPSRAGWVGPLFSWELIRLARRGQDARARFILAVSLLFVLTIFTLVWFRQSDPWNLFTATSQSMPLEQSARFGEQFALTFLFTQLAVLCLLTPAYAAGGISEEKEKQTFIFILISDLTSREILLGKFLGRLVFLLGIMFAGLPILSITQLYGGVSLKFLLVGYLITATTITMLAAISAASAVAVDTYRGALFRSYGLTALHVFVGCGLHPILSPFGIIFVLWGMEANAPETFYAIGLAYPAVQLLVAFGAIWMGVRWVRKMRAKPVRNKKADRAESKRKRPEGLPVAKLRGDDQLPSNELLILDEPIEFVADGNAEPLPTAKLVRVIPPSPVPSASRSTRDIEPPPFRRRRRPPPVRMPVPEEIRNRPRVDEKDPFLWKEKYTTGLKRTADDDSMRGVLIAVGVAVGIIVAFMAVIALVTVFWSFAEGRRSDAGSNIFLITGAGCFFTYLLVIGAAATGSVVRERQRLTLESLLAIPVDRRTILWPKWRMSIVRSWALGIPGVVLIPLGFLVSDVPQLVLPMSGFVAVAIPCAVSYGMWLSIRCRTATKAVMWLQPMIGGLTLAPLVIWKFSDEKSWLVWFILAVVVSVLTAAAAWLFWVQSIREFEQDGRN